MVKYKNASTKWKHLVEQELDDYYHHQEDNNQDFSLGYEY